MTLFLWTVILLFAWDALAKLIILTSLGRMPSPPRWATVIDTIIAVLMIIFATILL